MPSRLYSACAPVLSALTNIVNLPTELVSSNSFTFCKNLSHKASGGHAFVLIAKFNLGCGFSSNNPQP